MSPFEEVYGRPPPVIPDYISGHATNNAVDSCLVKRKELLLKLKERLIQSQARMKSQADSHSSERVFEKGNWVLVKLQPYKQRSVAQRSSKKLSKRYFDKFLVLKRVGKVAYKLSLPETSRIHPVFHVSLLKRCAGDPSTSAMIPLPESNEDQHIIFQPSGVVGHRWIMGGNGLVKEVVIQWEGLPAEEATLDDVTVVAKAFLHLNLVEQVRLGGEGIDTLADAAADQRAKRKREKPKHLQDYVVV